MYNHAPEDYVCPFCLLIQSVEHPSVYSRQSDIVYRGEAVTAFIGSHQWPNNHGNVLVVTQRALMAVDEHASHTTRIRDHLAQYRENEANIDAHRTG